MKNKKTKLLISFLCLFLLLTAAIGLVGCNKKHTHDFSIEKADARYLATEATCQKKATYYYSCSCGESEHDDKHTFVSGNALGHKYGDWTTTKEPTETVKGERKKTCSVCGDVVTEKIPVLNHTTHTFTVRKVEPAYLASAATCTEPAKYYYVCTGCSEHGDETFNEGNALGHTEVVDAAVAATCTEKGKTEGKHCSVCNTVLVAQTEVPATGHTEVVDAAVAATCTEKGKTEGKHCSRCKAVIVAQEEIGALGHEYEDEWTVDVKPTCTEPGSKSYHCKRCGVKSSVTKVDPLGHKVNGECVCEICGVTSHALNDDCVCTNCKKVMHGTKNGKYCRHGSDIYFGTYPQTEVTDSTITAELKGMAGKYPTAINSYNWTSYGYYIEERVTDFMWYIDLTYNGEKYRGVYFISYRPFDTKSSSSTHNSCQDDCGYSTHNIYWFKYEPIKWKILSESDGKAMIVADMVLDNQQYYHTATGKTRSVYSGSVYENNYAHSDVRKWLNNAFYNTAFNDLQKELIQVTAVYNSASTTKNSNNKYAYDKKTNDNVFLLSYAEASTMTESERQKGNTDYSKCQGATVSRDNGYGYWSLRSPGSGNGKYICVVLGGGYISDTGLTNATSFGIVPALWIRL